MPPSKQLPPTYGRQIQARISAYRQSYHWMSFGTAHCELKAARKITT